MSLLATWAARLKTPHTPVQRRAWIRAEMGPDTDLGPLFTHVEASLRSDAQRASALARVVYLAARHTRRAHDANRALRLMGHGWTLRGEPRRARLRLRAAYDASAPADRAGVASELSHCLAELGRDAEALDVLREAREALGRGQARVRALVDLSEATLLVRMDRSDDALALLDRARRTLVRARATAAVPLVDGNRANALSNLGRYDHAERLYQRVTRHFVDQGQQATAWQSEYNHAYLETLRGRFQSALLRFVDVRKGFQDLGDRRHVALCDADMAEVHLRLDMPDEALDCARRAAPVLEELGIALDAARARYFEAVALRELGDLDGASEALRELCDAFGHLGNAAWEAMSRARLAELDFAGGRLHDAREGAQAAAEVLWDLGWRERAGRVELLLADLELAGGDFAAVADRLRRIAAQLGDVHAPWLHCEMEHRHAQRCAALGEVRRAVYHALRGVRILERHRIGVPPDEYMTAFLRAKQALYATALRAVLTLGGRRAQAVAFRLAEQSRSRALLDLMSSGAPKANQMKLRQRAVEIEQELVGLQGRMPPADGKTRRWTTLQPRERRAGGRRQRLQRCLTSLADRAQTWARALPGPEDVERLLAPDEALVEYVLCDDRVLVFVVRRHGTSMQELPLSRAHIEQRVQAASFHLERPTCVHAELPQAPLVAAAHEALEGLHEALIAPLGDLEGTRQLIVVPAGPLHPVPFGALVANGRCLFETHTVLMAPSAAIWMRCRARRTAGQRGLLALGVPDERAPQIGAEIRHLASRDGTTEAYAGASATSEVLRERGPHAGTIHLATHAVFDALDPMRSGVLLADGWLSISDLYRFRLDADLLVLAGCSTARSRVTAAEEPLGLARGFLGAGVARMVASLWPVDDAATRTWMIEFYRLRAAGLTAAACVRDAALAVRTQYPHPSHWAPFVLLGADDVAASESER